MGAAAIYGHGKSHRPICTKEAAENKWVGLPVSEVAEGMGLGKGSLVRIMFLSLYSVSSLKWKQVCGANGGSPYQMAFKPL